MNDTRILEQNGDGSEYRLWFLAFWPSRQTGIPGELVVVIKKTSCIVLPGNHACR